MTELKGQTPTADSGDRGLWSLERASSHKTTISEGVPGPAAPVLYQPYVNHLMGGTGGYS